MVRASDKLYLCALALAGGRVGIDSLPNEQYQINTSCSVRQLTLDLKEQAAPRTKTGGTSGSLLQGLQLRVFDR